MHKFFHKHSVRLTAIAFLSSCVAGLSGCEPGPQPEASTLQTAPQSVQTRPVSFDMGVSAEVSETFETESVRFDSLDLLHAEFANTGEMPVRIELEAIDDDSEVVLSRRIEVGPRENSRSTLNVGHATGCNQFDYKLRYTVYYLDALSADSPSAHFEFQFRPSDPDARAFRGECSGLECKGFDFSVNAPPADIGALDCQ